MPPVKTQGSAAKDQYHHYIPRFILRYFQSGTPPSLYAALRITLTPINEMYAIGLNDNEQYPFGKLTRQEVI